LGSSWWNITSRGHEAVGFQLGRSLQSGHWLNSWYHKLYTQAAANRKNRDEQQNCKGQLFPFEAKKRTPAHLCWYYSGDGLETIYQITIWLSLILSTINVDQPVTTAAESCQAKAYSRFYFWTPCVKSLKHLEEAR